MTTTSEEFTTALDAAFASVSEEDLNKLLKNWGDKESFRTRLINQFNSWPDVLKDKVKIDVQIDPDYFGPHRFLSFKDVNLAYVNLENVDLENVDLKGANLGGAQLKGADLEGAQLTCSCLVDADLENADLRGACFLGANLRGANLSGADLEGAHLKGAYLEGARLQDTNLEGAHLKGAYLEGANLKGATGLVDRYQNKHITLDADTMRVTINSKTILPDELLCCYFNSALYPKNKGFIENPTTFDQWKKNFVDLYQDSSCRIVTPPQSKVNLRVSEDSMEKWVVAMLPRLEDAWNKREQDPTRLGIQQFLKNLEGGAQQG